MPNRLTMTTSSDLRLAPYSVLASGHMVRWEEWEECSAQRLWWWDCVNSGAEREQGKM